MSERIPPSKRPQCRSISCMDPYLKIPKWRSYLKLMKYIQAVDMCRTPHPTPPMIGLNVTYAEYHSMLDNLAPQLHTIIEVSNLSFIMCFAWDGAPTGLPIAYCSHWCHQTYACHAWRQYDQSIPWFSAPFCSQDCIWMAALSRAYVTLVCG